ncbi:glycosyltransferase family 4 protein [Desulfoluna sp.]|uniref:glycosyltransferase family 4 protein n=1 Tax=Desulfoluna sp. TaxID=2045199 RepID=UPI002638DE60|nr:glycosyltransferase family 4 protein [Desulfoluna sp.]
MNIKNRILVITRNYPPKIGGLETFSFNLIQNFEKRASTYKITLSKSNIHLLWFIPYSLFLASFMIKRYRIQKVHLCDGVLSPIGFILKAFFRIQVTVTIHGLDITYSNRSYQLFIPRILSHLDKIVCVSRSTLTECVNRGMSASKCIVIGNGVNANDFKLNLPKNEISYKFKKIVDFEVNSKKILLTVGRLVQRKGVVWFLENVFYKLDENYIYLIVGSGPEYGSIAKTIMKYSLENRVKVFSGLSDLERNIVYHSSDLFIMPNIIVDGDVEGFGITAIEAGVCGLPVVASDLQGIKDAVVNEITGILIQVEDSVGYSSAIINQSYNRKVIAEYVMKNFSWDKCIDAYFSLLF